MTPRLGVMLNTDFEYCLWALKGFSDLNLSLLTPLDQNQNEN